MGSWKTLFHSYIKHCAAKNIFTRNMNYIVITILKPIIITKKENTDKVTRIISDPIPLLGEGIKYLTDLVRIELKVPTLIWRKAKIQNLM